MVDLNLDLPSSANQHANGVWIPERGACKAILDMTYTSVGVAFDVDGLCVRIAKAMATRIPNDPHGELMIHEKRDGFIGLSVSFSMK